MIKIKVQNFIRLLTIFFVAGSIFPLSAMAGETPWQTHGQEVRSRIISAVDGLMGADAILLGLELVVADGWKTYWRSPGEAGLPPHLTLLDDSMDGMDMRFPMPKRFELFGLQTYGYSKQIVFPVYVDSSNFIDGKIQLKADFMVCKDICIPYSSQYELSQGSGAVKPSVQAVKLNAYLKKVPDTDGDAGAELNIVEAHISGAEGSEKLIVKVSANASLVHPELLPESTAPVKFGKPETRLDRDGSSVWFAFPVMTGRSKVSLKGKTICLTFDDGRGHAIERCFGLPA